MHHFRYRAFWLLLDLDELDDLSSKLRCFSYNRSNIFSFYDADHGDGTATPLRVQLECHLAEAKVDLAGGRIRLLCMPRTLGYCFNPISIFFCYRSDATLAAVVYQVHNRSVNGIATSSGLRARTPRCISAAESCSTSRPSWKWTCGMTSGSPVRTSASPSEYAPVHRQSLC